MNVRSAGIVAVSVLLCGCDPAAGSGGPGPAPGEVFVTRAEQPEAQRPAPEPGRSYLLQSLADSARVRFDFFSSEAVARRTGAEVYRLVLRTPGRAAQPTHAVYAEWQLEDASTGRGFEQSRRELFALRVEHLESFHADYLLQSVSEPLRYLILGLYADEEGLRLAREHPQIRGFAEQNPPARFGARDLYGIRTFHIVPQ